MVTLRCMRVPEAEVRLVEGMHKGKKGRVSVGSEISEEFSVTISLRQGSSLSPLMFIMVIELVSRKVSLKCSMGRMFHADDLVVVVETGEWVGNAGSTGGMEGSISQAWAED